MTDDPHLGAFAQVPDGQLRAADAARVHDAIARFEAEIVPLLGRMPKLAGAAPARRTAAVAAIAAGIEAGAEAAWLAALPGQPSWPKGGFAADAAETLDHAARDPSLHFGDAALKELITARTGDLIVLSFEIQAFGARRDRREIERAQGRVAMRVRLRGERDRAILEGARPYSKPAPEDPS